MLSTTPSSTQRMLSRFEGENAPLARRSRRLLARVAAKPALQARLLNTLSLLEHMGCRKIMATQSGAGMEHATLRHLSEEARHALFFRRQAEKAAGCALDYAEECLCAPSAARMYFQRLDATVARAARRFPGRRAPYLYMSMTVEFRALWLYRLYQEVLDDAGIALSFRTVLAEEAEHLGQMAGRLESLGCYDEDCVLELCGAERVLYERLLSALEREAAA